MLPEPGLKAILRMEDMIVMARHDDHLLPNLKILPVGSTQVAEKPYLVAAS